VVIASGSQSPHRLFGEIDGGLSQGLHIDLLLDFLLEKTFQLALSSSLGTGVVRTLMDLAVTIDPVPERLTQQAERRCHLGDQSLGGIHEGDRLLAELGWVSGLTSHDGSSPPSDSSALGAHQTGATPIASGPLVQDSGLRFTNFSKMKGP
jgi:hypothetical protein